MKSHLKTGVFESEILTGQFRFYLKNAECANRYVRQKTKYKSLPSADITFSAQARKHFGKKRLALSCLEVVHYMEVHNVQNIYIVIHVYSESLLMAEKEQNRFMKN